MLLPVYLPRAGMGLGRWGLPNTRQPWASTMTAAPPGSTARYSALYPSTPSSGGAGHTWPSGSRLHASGASDPFLRWHPPRASLNCRKSVFPREQV